MGIRLKKLAETWDNRRAIGVSGSNLNFGLILRDILSKRDWKFHEICTSVQEAYANLTIGHGCLLVIDDTPESPASYVLRQQLFDPVASVVPTLVLYSESSENDLKCMKRMGTPVLIRKPITPQSFIDAFDKLIEKWSTGYLVEVRRAAQKMAAGQFSHGYQVLEEIVRTDQAVTVAACALSLQYRQGYDLVKTEQILQEQLKKGAFDMNIVLPLIDLYMYSASPAKALSLIHKANEVYDNPNFLCIDAIQANLLMNRISQCVPYLKQMIENDYYPEIARHYLPRIVYSSGMFDAFDKAIRYRPERFDEYQRAWHLLSDKDAERRKAQYEKVSQIKKTKAREERQKGQAGTQGNESTAQKLEKVPEEKKYIPFGHPLFKK